MMKPVHDLTAEVKPDPGRFFVLPAIEAGVAFLKDPGQVFLLNSNPVIGNHKGIPVAVDPDTPAGWSILQGIGKDLFYHKGEPFFIGEDSFAGFLKVQGNFPQDKKPGEFPHSLFQKRVQGAVPEEVISRTAVKPEVAQDHFDVLFDFQQFGLDFRKGLFL